MEYIKPEEKKELSNCQTIGDMLIYLNKNFDLSIIPPLVTKIIFINALTAGINMLKPRRRDKITGKLNKVKSY